MDTYKVKPIFLKPDNNFHLQTRVPGSKSITNRALLLAALCPGTVTLTDVLFSDDSRHFIQCLKDLGFELTADEQTRRIVIRGCGGKLPRQSAFIDVGSAGTAARFLTAMLGLAPGTWHLTASEQMKKRPMAPLLESLTRLGCTISYEEKPGFFPFTIHSSGISASRISIDIGQSSQFLSALLMSAVLLDHDFTIDVQGSHGFSYILMTLKMMEQFGIHVEQLGRRTFRIPGNARAGASSYAIEPDLSAAAYFYSMAALSGGEVQVPGVFSTSMQGDLAFLGCLRDMGCSCRQDPQGIVVKGPAGGKLKGLASADLSAFSDQALTLAAIAPFADTPTTIRGIGHIRLQECDRIHAIVSNLALMSIRTEQAAEDEITIFPGSPSPARIRTYDDHRVAMAFSLPGLRAPGIVIENPLCCRKTFEDYFTILSRITGGEG